MFFKTAATVTLMAATLASATQGYRFYYQLDVYSEPDYKGHHKTILNSTALTTHPNGICTPCVALPETVRSFKFDPWTDPSNMELRFFPESHCKGTRQSFKGPHSESHPATSGAKSHHVCHFGNE
ncbi:hypothetical protein BV22DRAFT_1033221 [Leucogyrophana mollusca]|uniref:Uncharacterized protein n=1 Tax=Leucogyrophana mollusca TaxID=85980 RepID=A0ACB8BJS2_9AGAM|nr:hypothetical protein BV22DRAFT_1033221 [Leucogyrophana mollusca]